MAKKDSVMVFVQQDEGRPDLALLQPRGPRQIGRLGRHERLDALDRLGGGSADGAFMLNMLNEKFKLAISHEQLLYYASQLGSDCSFFIDNKASFVDGTGDIFSPINVDLKGMFIAIIYPQIHVDTNSAYKNITPLGAGANLKNMLEKNNCKDWPKQIANDFEKNADNAIIQLKDKLYTQGALYASMTGSGSAVFGFFTKAPAIATEHPHIITQL